MSDQYKTTLALLESCTQVSDDERFPPIVYRVLPSFFCSHQDGGHMKAAVTGLKEYSRHVLQRLQHHLGKAVAALVAMSDVVESVSAACLMDYVEEVEQMGVKSLPLAPTDLQSLLSATVKVSFSFQWFISRHYGTLLRLERTSQQRSRSKRPSALFIFGNDSVATGAPGVRRDGEHGRPVLQRLRQVRHGQLRQAGAAGGRRSGHEAPADAAAHPGAHHGPHHGRRSAGLG